MVGNAGKGWEMQMNDKKTIKCCRSFRNKKGYNMSMSVVKCSPTVIIFLELSTHALNLSIVVIAEQCFSVVPKLFPICSIQITKTSND